MKRLSETALVIDEGYTDSHLFGSVTTTSQSQLMFTSIPYDEGWNIYVDGQKVDIYEANNSLVAFRVEGAGTHNIEMKYMPTTIALGIFVSIASLVVFILILIAYPFAKRVPFLRRFLMIEGEELPLLATPEYRAELETDDLGVPDGEEPTSDEMIAEAKEARYGKIKGADHLLNKKTKKKPSSGTNTKGSKK